MCRSKKVSGGADQVSGSASLLPVVDPQEAEHEYGIKLESWDALPRAELLVLAVPHRQLLGRAIGEYKAKAAPGAVFVDVKSRFDSKEIAASGFAVWRL